MILKISYFDKHEEKNPNHNHIRVLDVYDFHIDAPTDDSEECSHELIYHTVNGKTGSCLLGRDGQNADHVYVMENGKTVDHMRFYANN
jgi:hypothetical protein